MLSRLRRRAPHPDRFALTEALASTAVRRTITLSESDAATRGEIRELRERADLLAAEVRELRAALQARGVL